MTSLFQSEKHIPLAERLRPKSFSEVIGQVHLCGSDAYLRLSVEAGNVHSCIFWGPPGVGKTTIARIIAQTAALPYLELSAISAGVKDVRAAIELAERSGRLVIFLDEIHRFNASQQDSLLAAMESGILIVIGATTENPSFELNRAILSRLKVYVLEPLSHSDLLSVAKLATESYSIDWQAFENFIDFIIQYAAGDARKLMQSIQAICEQYAVWRDSGLQIELLQQILSKSIAYDKSGEMHYDLVSAMIKSIRGSDADAGVYYMMRMVEGGEDPTFIARRLLILASEDIGLANPSAMGIANAAFEAVEKLGYPEAVYPLTQLVMYLAKSPKSNSVYRTIKSAKAVIQETGNLEVPLHLRNAQTALMKKLGYGKEYLYPHNYPKSQVQQQYLPDAIVGKHIAEHGENDKL